jgi:hypothetical protein
MLAPLGGDEGLAAGEDINDSHPELELGKILGAASDGGEERFQDTREGRSRIDGKVFPSLA